MGRKLRHPACAFALGAALVGDDVIRACYKSKGTLYVVGLPGAPATCAVGDVPLQWGMQGPKGEPGTPGAPGVFTGQFRSPNGQFALDVTDRGVRLSGPGGLVEVNTHGVRVNGVLYAKVGARQVHLGGKCKRIAGTRRVYGC